MRTFIFLLVIASYSVAFQTEEKCPDISDIRRCKCKTYLDGACIISCSLSAQDTIQNLTHISNLCSGHVHFFLIHSKISGIPSTLWKTLLSSETVDITIKRTSLQGLMPPGDETIPEVRILGPAVIKIDHSIVNQWDWKVFQNFHPEELTIVIDDTTLTKLDPDFSQIAGGRVNKVSIDSAGLTELPDGIFANFKDLKSLSLQNNELTSILRSVMPKPASKLEYLHLNGNQLTTLPEDLFSDMASLEVVYLRDNKLTSLPEKLFEYISSTHIQTIDLIRNPWTCDCTLMNILQNSKHRSNLGSCSSPESLAGKQVKDLSNLLDC